GPPVTRPGATWEHPKGARRRRPRCVERPTTWLRRPGKTPAGGPRYTAVPAGSSIHELKLFEHGAQRCRSLGIGGDECLADRHIARGLRLELVRQLTDDRIEFEHGADILRLKLRPADETVDLAHQTRPAQ